MNLLLALGAGEWTWQWTAPFGVLLGYFLGAMLWIRGSRWLASTLTVIATLLGVAVIAAG